MTTQTDQALELRCPKCKAKPGAPCTYMPQALGPYQAPDLRWGTPTRRPHNERMYQVRRRDRDRAIAEFHAERAILLADPVGPERRALAELARQEHAQIRAWLALHSTVLTKVNR